MIRLTITRKSIVSQSFCVGLFPDFFKGDTNQISSSHDGKRMNPVLGRFHFLFGEPT